MGLFGQLLDAAFVWKTEASHVLFPDLGFVWKNTGLYEKLCDAAFVWKTGPSHGMFPDSDLVWKNTDSNSSGMQKTETL